MGAGVGRKTGVEQLGGYRFGARGELRALPRLLRGEEQVLGMVLGSVGNWRGRLFVATDSRVLLVSKLPLRRVRCTDFPYEGIQVSDAAPEPGGMKLSVVVSGEPQTWNLVSAERAERFIRVINERGRVNGDTTEQAAGGASTQPPAPVLRLLLNLVGLAVVVLFFVDVLPRDPALVAFLGTALVLALVESRAATPALQIGLGIVTAVAVALFVFEILPFGVGALIAAAAIAAEIAVRRRGEGSDAHR
jgi:Bacterial PH domain